MDDRSLRVADYFVVAGLQDTSRLLEEDMQHESGLKPSKPKGPITDVAVIIKSQGEKVPADFECLETTPSGFQADLNHGSLRSPAVYLCYRRGFDKPPLTDIGILLEGKERVMPGCEIVSTTPCGRPANVNNRTGMGNQRIYITYRRASETAAHNSLAVTDVCVILTNKGEMPPHAFCMIDKNLNKGMTGSDVYLCYKKSMTRANAITYTAGIISRYPEKDYETTTLPESVPLFCLPMGASIECWSAKRNHPLPVFSTFVLTDSQAVKMYGAAVSFYEEYSESKLDEDQKMKLGILDKDKEETYKEKWTVYTNKCICLLSMWPFFDAFKKFLSYLYRLSVSGPHSVPIERHIAHFMHEVPFPTAQRPRIMMPLAHDSLFLVQPQTSPLPLSGASYTALLRNLGPENCLTLLLFAVTEHKILLHSLRPAVLTSVAEAVSTMISPFTWQCPYIPLCPLGLSAVLNAPIPFIVGVDSRYFDIYDPPTDVVCVDLDTNTISQSDERRFMNWKMLPKKAAKQLRHTLTRLCTELYTVPAYSEGDDATVEMAPLNPDFTRKKKQLAMEHSIQEAYFRFMASILHGYKHYLLPITQQPSERTTDPSSLFNLQGFLKSRDKANHKFFTQLMRTQTFIHFIEERSFVSSNDASLAFFDECIEKVDPECKVETKLIEIEDSFENERTVFVTPPEPITSMEYRYTVFPELKKELFELCAMQNLAVHKAVSRSSIPSSPMIRRTKQEVKLAQQSAKKNASNPKLWAKCLLGYSFSVWFIHLPAFVRSTHSKTKALRTAFERLIVMGSYKLEPPDEICYRVLMQLCGQFGQPVLAVKVLMEMRKSGVQPNAITYGFYNRAVLESKWPATTSSGYILWTKLRNVIMAVAQFRRKLKVEPDGFSQCSSDSYNDETVGDHVTDLIKLDSPIATDDKSSTGGHSDMGYGSMSIDDGSRSDNTPSSQKSTTETDMCQSEELLKETKSGQGDNARFDPIDISSSEGLRPRVNSIVRNSVGSFGSASSMGTLRGSTSSAAGLLITSQNSLDVEESVFDTASEANNMSKVRKRHKSAGDHISRHNRNVLRNRNFSGESNTTITLTLAKESSTESEPGSIKADNFAFDARILEGLTSSDPKLDSSKTKVQKVKKSTKFDLDELYVEEEEEEEEEDIIPSYIRRSNSEGQNPIHARKLMERNKRRKEEQMKAKQKQEMEFKETKCGNEEVSVKEEEMQRSDSNLEIILQEFDDLTPNKDRDDSPELDSEGEGELNSEEAERARSSSISIKSKPFHEDTSIQIKSSSFDDKADMQWGSGHIDDIPHSLPNPALSPSSPPEEFQRQDSASSDKLPQRSFSSNFLQGLIQQVAQSPQTTAWFGSSPFSKKGNDGSASSSKLDALKAAASAVANKIGSYTKQAKSMTLATTTKSSSSSIPQDVEDSESLLSFKDGNESKHGMWTHSNSDTNLVGQLLMDEWFPPPSTALMTGSTPSLNGPFGDQIDTPLKQTSSQSLFNYVMEVNLSSCSRCTKCNTLLHDEAIMAGWSADDSNLNTTCCFCGSQFVPFLYITIRDLRSYGVGRSMLSPSQSSESMQSIQSAPSSQLTPTSSHQSSTVAKSQESRDSSAENLLHETDYSQIPEEEDEARDCLESESPRQLKYVRNLSSPAELLQGESETDGSMHSKSEPRVIKRPARTEVRRRCTSECHTSTTETVKSEERRNRYSSPAGGDFNTGGDEDLLSSSLSSSIQGSREYLPPQRKSHNPDPVAVPYLSPLVLRKEMENVIDHEGEHCLLSADFVDEHPIIFWNLIWVYKRLDLPSNLPGLILSANSINKDYTPTSSQWLSRDSRHVLVNVIWDTLKPHEEIGQPMYLMWNAIQQGSPLVNALVTEQQPFSRQFMQNVVSSIQCNDVLTPIKWMLEQYRKRPAQHRHWSIYRDLLFLALVACGRENIDIDAFDREYEIAFERLIEEYWGPKQLEKLQEDDKPLSDAVFWCRKIFSEAGELKL
ncbi:C-myc promoter-binding protein-like isoform X2 [Glandiceps talaboti]